MWACGLPRFYRGAGLGNLGFRISLACDVMPQVLHRTGENMSDSVYSVQVESEVVYAEDQSDVAADIYVFHYHIRILNLGSQTAQLMSRHWIITDANNQVQEVRGMGVVGQQPEIEPGHQYEYSSSTSLKTPYGSMSGLYHLVSSDGTRFEAEIPEMQLVAHRVLH